MSSGSSATGQAIAVATILYDICMQWQLYRTPVNSGWWLINWFSFVSIYLSRKVCFISKASRHRNKISSIEFHNEKQADGDWNSSTIVCCPCLPADGASYFELRKQNIHHFARHCCHHIHAQLSSSYTHTLKHHHPISLWRDANLIELNIDIKHCKVV